jgi:hypothetical protein
MSNAICNCNCERSTEGGGVEDKFAGGPTLLAIRRQELGYLSVPSVRIDTLNFRGINISNTTPSTIFKFT